MHVKQSLRPGAFVQVIDILRHDQKLARPLRVEPGKRVMRCIGLDGAERRAPCVIEAVDGFGIARKRLRGAHILDAMPLPQPAGAAKGGDAAFGGNPRAGEDDDILDAHSPTITLEIGRERPVSASGTSAKQAERTQDSMTRIGILGSEGRMGRAIAAAIEEAGASLAGGVDARGDPRALAEKSDVLVDFTAPAALAANLDAAVAATCPIVIGTTGLSDDHHAAIDQAASKIAVLQTGNTSLGIVMLCALVRQAAAALGPGWDVEIAEMHHRMKVDAPSGTALMLGQAAAEGHGDTLAEVGVSGRVGHTGARETGAIGFSALRGGTVAGDHMVVFAGEGERIELTHRAEDRMIFARGAVRGAQWLKDQQPGRYTMKQVLGM